MTDRELDAAFAREVLGLTYHETDGKHFPDEWLDQDGRQVYADWEVRYIEPHTNPPLPHYTQSLDAAWSDWEKQHIVNVEFDFEPLSEVWAVTVETAEPPDFNHGVSECGKDENKAKAFVLARLQAAGWKPGDKA